MNYLKKLIFLSPLVLACGEPSAASKDDKILEKLQSWVPSEIKLPKNHEPIKVFDFNFNVIFKKNFDLNYLKISDYKDFVDLGKENIFYCYYISGEGKHFLVQQGAGVVAECDERDGFFFPKTIYFELKNKNFARMNIEHSDDQTKFIYRNSCVVVNNKTVTTNPFDLDKSKIEFSELKEFANNLFDQFQGIFYPKILFDCTAAKQGAKFVYLDEDYFSPQFQSKEKQVKINFKDGVESIKAKLEKYQKMLLAVEDNQHKLFCMKLSLSFPVGGLEAAGHAVLLVLYKDENNKNRWLFLDSNRGLPHYYQVNKNNLNHSGNSFIEALKKLDIKFCENDIYGQKGNGCDTSASINSFLLSSYVGKNGKLDFTEDGNIDFKKIYYFAEKEGIWISNFLSASFKEN